MVEDGRNTTSTLVQAAAESQRRAAGMTGAAAPLSEPHGNKALNGFLLASGAAQGEPACRRPLPPCWRDCCKLPGAAFINAVRLPVRVAARSRLRAAPFMAATAAAALPGAECMLHSLHSAASRACKAGDGLHARGPPQAQTSAPPFCLRTF